jgi:hypothetical protein
MFVLHAFVLAKLKELKCMGGCPAYEDNERFGEIFSSSLLLSFAVSKHIITKHQTGDNNTESKNTPV